MCKIQFAEAEYRDMVLQILLLFCFLPVCVTQDEVCYGICGCFSNAPPYENRPLPPSPGELGLVMELFTRSNPQIPVNITIPEDGPPEIPPEYDPSNPTAFVIHGWLESSVHMDGMKNALLESSDLPPYNVILVDWTAGASGTYPVTANNLRTVGACAGAVAPLLQGPQLDTVHCIGHSLGGHTCGQMGKFVKNTTDSMLGRISGLDQPIAFFDTDDLRVRLDRSDASFVDIIRTIRLDSENIESPEEIGHVIFYPNNALSQPGCEPGDVVCDHIICVYHYEESIRNSDSCTFQSYPCGSFEDADAGMCETCEEGVDCQRMGFYATPQPEGTYYLRTVAEPPYCEE